MRSSKTRVLLVDDHATLRGGLEALLGLEADLEVVGQASTGEEALDKVRLLRPYVVVISPSPNASTCFSCSGRNCSGISSSSGRPITSPAA